MAKSAINISSNEVVDPTSKHNEEQKEQHKTSQPVQQPTENDQDDPRGAAQQSPPAEMSNKLETAQVQRTTKEETKEPEPIQTIDPVERATMSVP